MGWDKCHTLCGTRHGGTTLLVPCLQPVPQFSPGHRKPSTHPIINTQNLHGHTFKKAAHATANLISCHGRDNTSSTQPHPLHVHANFSRPLFQQIATDTSSHLKHVGWVTGHTIWEHHWPTMPRPTGSIITRFNSNRTTHCQQ